MPPAPSSFDGSDSVALPLFPLFLPTNPQILAHALPFGLYWPFLSRFFLLLKTESFLSAFKNRGGFPLPCLWPQGLPISKPFRLFLRVQTDLFCSLMQAHTSQEVSRRLSNQYHKDTGQFFLKPIQQCKARLPRCFDEVKTRREVSRRLTDQYRGWACRCCCLCCCQ